MKKILYIDNQEDLVNALCRNNNITITLIIDCLLIDNLGMLLLKETINNYNTNNHTFLLNVGNSLPYLIFAIENNFSFIITTFNNINIDNFKKLAKNHNCKIFNFTENIFRC